MRWYRSDDIPIAISEIFSIHILLMFVPKAPIFNTSVFAEVKPLIYEEEFTS